MDNRRLCGLRVIRNGFAGLSVVSYIFTGLRGIRNVFIGLCVIRNGFVGLSVISYIFTGLRGIRNSFVGWWLGGSMVLDMVMHFARLPVSRISIFLIFISLLAIIVYLFLRCIGWLCCWLCGE